MEANAFAPGRVLGERYRVVRVLGKGGYGRVLEVEHLHTLQRLALKLLREDLWDQPQVVERFMREASAASRIGDEHIVKTVDAGRFGDGTPYVAMELLQGESVRAVLDRERHVSVGLATEWVAQAAEGAHAAHLAGIVHRDLKPDNLFVVRAATGPLVKVLDFGLSRFALGDDAPDLTRTKDALGTPLYMAPEAFRGVKGLGPTLDVYALGAMLYELLCGSPPFDAVTLRDLMTAIQEAPLRPLSGRAVGIDSALDAVVAKAMAKEPAARFQTAAELAKALRPWRRRDAPAPPPPRAAPISVPVPSTLVPVPSTLVPVPSTLVPGRSLPAIWLVFAVVLAASLALGLALVRRQRADAAARVAEAAPAENALITMGMPVAVLRGSAGPGDWRSLLAAEMLTRNLSEGSLTGFLPQEEVEAYQFAQGLFPQDGLDVAQLKQVRRALDVGIVMHLTLSPGELTVRIYPLGPSIGSVHRVTVAGDDFGAAALELRAPLMQKLTLRELTPAEERVLRGMGSSVPEANERYATGRLLFHQGRIADADAALRRAVELDPHLVLADDTLATLAGLEGKPAEENRWSAAAVAAIAKGPEVTQLVAFAVDCHRAVIAGTDPSMCEALTTFVPESLDAWRLRMRGELERGHYERVETAYRTMPERMHADPAAQALRCEAFRRASSPMFQQACQGDH